MKKILTTKRLLLIVLLVVMPLLQGCALLATAASGYAIYQMIEGID